MSAVIGGKSCLEYANLDPLGSVMQAAECSASQQGRWDSPLCLLTDCWIPLMAGVPQPVREAAEIHF